MHSSMKVLVLQPHSAAILVFGPRGAVINYVYIKNKKIPEMEDLYGSRCSTDNCFFSEAPIRFNLDLLPPMSAGNNHISIIT